MIFKRQLQEDTFASTVNVQKAYVSLILVSLFGIGKFFLYATIEILPLSLKF